MKTTVLSAVVCGVIVTGCAPQMPQQPQQSNEAIMIEQLKNRISALEAHQSELHEQLKHSSMRVPTGIVAVPATRQRASIEMTSLADDTSGYTPDPIVADDMDAAYSQTMSTAADMPPPSSGDELDQAIALYKAGDISSAIAQFEYYIANQDNDAQRRLLAHYWLGDALYTQRSFESANRYLGLYIKENPNGEKTSLALEKLVDSLRSLGRTLDADILEEQGASALIGY